LWWPLARKKRRSRNGRQPKTGKAFAEAHELPKRRKKGRKSLGDTLLLETVSVQERKGKNAEGSTTTAARRKKKLVQVIGRGPEEGKEKERRGTVRGGASYSGTGREKWVIKKKVKHHSPCTGRNLFTTGSKKRKKKKNGNNGRKLGLVTESQGKKEKVLVLTLSKEGGEKKRPAISTNGGGKGKKRDRLFELVP